MEIIRMHVLFLSEEKLNFENFDNFERVPIITSI
jgi:hypothetical protein